MQSRENDVNLVGQKFSRLYVIKKQPYSIGGRTWLCQCDCGNLTDATTAQLRHGNKQSCGCLRYASTKDNGKVLRAQSICKKPYSITVWLTKQQREKIENKSQYFCISMAEYVRQLIDEDEKE